MMDQNQEDQNQEDQNDNHEEMSTQDIVRISMERTQPGIDWEEVYAYMYHGIQSSKFRMLRRRDSLLFFQVTPPVARNMHLFTADDQSELKVSLQEFFKALKIAGYKKGVGEVENPATLRLMRMAGLEVKQAKTPDGYSFEVEAK
jgi:hypothetical protein